MLDVPECPESLAYLRDWCYALHGRCGAGMGGLNLLSYAEVGWWAMLTGNHPTPEEVEALVRLDLVLMNPDEEETNG